ncbi:MAG: hypothetical protein ACLFQJ_03385 [Campylobacterales bacterium]
MIRFFIVSLFFTLSLFASTLSSGDSFPLDIKLQDQFEKPYSIEGKEIIVFSADKDSGKFAHNVIDAYPSETLEEKKIAYISDMSSVPSLIYSFFMESKFQKYDYKLGLIWEEDDAAKLPKKENQATLFKLDGKTIEEIVYFKDEDSLKAYIDSH